MPSDKNNILKQLDLFDNQHNQRLAAYEAQVTAILDQARNEAARIAATTKPNPAKVFNFANYPQTKERIDKLTKGLFSDLATSIKSNVRAEWDAAELKNDDLLRWMNKGKDPTPDMISRYGRKNLAARDAFQNRIVGGLTISDRVWNLTGQFRSEIEAAVDYAITQGIPANKLATEIQKYLKHPDKLFRRVRGADGKLRLSKPAQAFHPGQGVYRSSYKNARRLAATETNIAYRTADHLRWQDMDFILGIEVKLSNNHTLNGVPFRDICDTIAGRYPKDFKFTGWHPLCRCRAIPILASQEEFIQAQRDLIEGREAKPYTGTVNQLPERYTGWIEKNAERINRSRSVPYFMTDNAKLIKTAGMPATTQQATQKIARAAEQEAVQLAKKKGIGTDEQVNYFAPVDDKQIQEYISKIKGMGAQGYTQEEARLQLIQANELRAKSYELAKKAKGISSQADIDALLDTCKNPNATPLQFIFRINAMEKQILMAEKAAAKASGKPIPVTKQTPTAKKITKSAPKPIELTAKPIDTSQAASTGNTLDDVISPSERDKLNQLRNTIKNHKFNQFNADDSILEAYDELSEYERELTLKYHKQLKTKAAGSNIYASRAWKKDFETWNDENRWYKAEYHYTADLTPNHVKALTGVSDDGLKVINSYTSEDFYEQTNKALRLGKIDEGTKRYVNLLNSALDEMPKCEGYVFRGTGGSFKTTQEIISNMEKVLKTGGVWEDPAFISTSRTSTGVLTNTIMMRIKSKTGRYIEDLSIYGKQEAEVLFKPNTKFRVLSIRRAPDKSIGDWLIEMEEI